MLVGEFITARDLERETSSWHPETFVSMCNLLVWAYSGRSSLPTFTERVNVKDGGIDAEIVIPDGPTRIPEPILGPGWNVLQYKVRDTGAQIRGRIVSGLQQKLRGALNQIKEKQRRYPDRYVLVVNVDLNPADISKIEHSVLEGVSDPNIHVVVVGAALLATMLNDNPHVRASYFVPRSFKTWQRAYESHRSENRIASGLDLIARDDELKRMRSWVDDPTVRIILLSGKQDSGKTRIALEATKHRASEVVVALDPRSMKLADYATLTTSRGETVCIVEDPPLEALELIVREALGTGGPKLIITMPAPQRIQSPFYGLDTRCQMIHLEPLSEQDSRCLVRACNQSLSFSIEDWIVRQGGGLPGVLLAAASVGRELHSTASNFAEVVGEQLQRGLEISLGPQSLQGARLLSVMTQVGIQGDYADEIRHISKVFESSSASDVVVCLKNLEEAGLVIRRGVFAEITPPILGNHLARELFQQQPEGILALFAHLERGGRMRLIERMSRAGGDAADKFADLLFERNGPLANLQSALTYENAPLLKYLAAAMPIRVLRFLEQNLINATPEERKAIEGSARRELMWALEQLLFRPKGSYGALRLIWLLAEAENENYGNNAQHVLKECFYVYHPQVPLRHAERLELLRQFTSSGMPRERRLVGIRAASDALKPAASVTLRNTLGPDPLGPTPPLTTVQVREYAENLVALYYELARDAEVTSAAFTSLPWMTAELIKVAPKTAIERFETLAEWAREAVPGLDVAGVVAAIRFTERSLSGYLEQSKTSSEQQEIRTYLASVTRLRSSLEDPETADFGVRLKNWTGSWASLDPDVEQEQIGGRPTFEFEIERLAEEAVKSPELLTPELTDLLLQDAAQRSYIFFFHLGEKDAHRTFLSVVDQLSSREDGAHAIAAYLGGWSRHDKESNAAEAHLEFLTTTGPATAKAIILATSWLPAKPSAVSRVVELIEARRINRDAAARTLTSGWLRELRPEDFERLVRAVAGRDLAHAYLAVRMFGMWMHLSKDISETLAIFGWECLQTWKIPNVQSDYHFDLLAAKLSSADSAKGFELLKRYSQEDMQNISPEHSIWDPLRHFGRTPKFWEVLHSSDALQLYRIVIEGVQRGGQLGFRLCWDMREIVAQLRDAAVLIQLAGEGLESARIIAQWLNGDREGFWPVLFQLHKLFPTDQDLHEKLAASIERSESGFAGRLSDRNSGIIQEIEAKLKDPSTPVTALGWLREIAERLSVQIGKEIIWEYNLDIDDLRGIIGDRNSPQRLWAIGRILKFARFEDILRLLTVEDIADALDQIDLPDERRRILEQAVPIWRHGN